jgi:hypothetical protein
MEDKIPDRHDDTVPVSRGQWAICGVELSSTAELSGRVTEIASGARHDGYTRLKLQVNAHPFGFGSAPVSVWIRSEWVQALEDMRGHFVVLSGYLLDTYLLHVTRPPRLADAAVNRVEITTPLHWDDASRRSQKARFDLERLALEDPTRLPAFWLDLPDDVVSLLNGHQLVRIGGHMAPSSTLGMSLVPERVEVVRDDIWVEPAWKNAPWSVTLDGHPVVNAFTAIGHAVARKHAIGAYTLVDVYSTAKGGERRRRSVWVPTARIGLLDRYQDVGVRLDGILGPDGSLHVDQPPRAPDGDGRPSFELRLEGLSGRGIGTYILVDRGFGEVVSIKYSGRWGDFGIDARDHVSLLLEGLADDPQARWKPILGGLRKAMPRRVSS